MPRAVLDSSTLISPFLTPKGVVSQLLHAPYRQRYELFLSEAILEEVVHDYLRWLIGQAGIVTDIPELRVVDADPKDDIIIATAVAARADFLVTGDRRHLRPLGTFESVRILTPRGFLDVIDQA